MLVPNRQVLSLLPELVGEGEIVEDMGFACFQVDTGAPNERVEVDPQPPYYDVEKVAGEVIEITPPGTEFSVRIHGGVGLGGKQEYWMTVVECDTVQRAATGVKDALLACRTRDERMRRATTADVTQMDWDAADGYYRCEPPEGWVIDWAEHDAHRGDGDDHDV